MPPLPDQIQQRPGHPQNAWSLQYKVKRESSFRLKGSYAAWGKGLLMGQVLIFLSNLRTVPRARLSC